jgi:hypothetical protein
VISADNLITNKCYFTPQSATIATIAGNAVGEMLPSVEDSKIDLLNMLAKDQVNIGNNHLISRK